MLFRSVKESIINAYEIKTGISRVKLSNLMDSESWFNAKKAVELGFADSIMFSKVEGLEEVEGLTFSNMVAVNSLLNKFPKDEKTIIKKEEIPIVEDGTSHKELEKRLNLIK